MTTRSCFVLAALALFAALLGPSAPAWGRGDLGFDRDQCVLKVGPDLMYFTGYQPNSEERKFCEDPPKVGKTIFVFDFAEPELREMKADFRILRQSSTGEETDANESAPIAYLPPATYPKGTLSYEYDFTEPGAYIGVVTVTGEQGERWVGRFPFTVAKPRYLEHVPYYLIGAAAILGLMLLLSRRTETRGGRFY
jgi:hypothetical protein